jgi:hypothetical protein
MALRTPTRAHNTVRAGIAERAPPLREPRRFVSRNDRPMPPTASPTRRYCSDLRSEPRPLSFPQSRRGRAENNSPLARDTLRLMRIWARGPLVPTYEGSAHESDKIVREAEAILEGVPEGPSCLKRGATVSPSVAGLLASAPGASNWPVTGCSHSTCRW